MYIVEFRNAQKGYEKWIKYKESFKKPNGTDCVKIIKFDTIEETNYTVNKLKKMGNEVRIIEKK